MTVYTVAYSSIENHICLKAFNNKPPGSAPGFEANLA